MAAQKPPAEGKVEQVLATLMSEQDQSWPLQMPSLLSEEHARYGFDVSREMPLPSFESAFDALVRLLSRCARLHESDLHRVSAHRHFPLKGIPALHLLLLILVTLQDFSTPPLLRHRSSNLVRLADELCPLDFELRPFLLFAALASALASFRSSSKSCSRASSLVRYPRYVWKSLRRARVAKIGQ